MGKFLKVGILLLFIFSLTLWILSPVNNFKGKIVTSTKAAFELNKDPSGKFIQDEIIVKYKSNNPDAIPTEKTATSSASPADQSDSNKVKSANETLRDEQAFYTKENFDLGGAKIIKVPAEKRDKLIEKLKKNPNVEYVEQNGLLRTDMWGGGGGGISGTGPVTNDSAFSAGKQGYLNSINALTAWLLLYKGSSANAVAVIDSGVNYDHPDLGLIPNGKVIKGYDFIFNDNNPEDDTGHGTQVAGIIGAITNNNSGVAGINWYTKILSFKACNGGWCPTASVAASLREAANYPSVRVINLSLSGDVDSEVLRTAVEFAQSRGKLIVASTWYDPTNGDWGNRIYNCFMTFPAAYNGVIAVSATNNSGAWSRGCTGNRAPNGTYYSPTLFSAPVVDLGLLHWSGSTYDYNVVAGSYTSYAAPQIAGVLSVLSDCSDNTKARAALVTTTNHNVGTPGYDAATGYGWPDLYKALKVYCFP